MAPQYKQNLKGLVKVSKSQYSSIVYISVVYMQRNAAASHYKTAET